MLQGKRLERYQNDLNLALYCVYLRSKKKKEKRKTRDRIMRRENEGAYTIFIERYLLDSQKDFRDYFRLSPTEFDYVLSAINSTLRFANMKFLFRLLLICMD